ncbi:hypothetical protein [Streptomyces subrutilus]|uniref:hypothetical protein n=1 Tax=Streptomyces subrutilus TaxID=36818 RepID=UPI001FCBECE1|nr:hypothetical protein [Streptomyces subrutilus]
MGHCGVENLAARPEDADFDEANIHATFDALGPDAQDRITMATYAANIEAYYAP